MNATPHVLESALLLLIAFFIGCLIGYALRRMFAKPSGSEPRAARTNAPATAVVPEPAPRPAVAPAPAPRTTASDNLQQIKGIGPAMEKRLKADGVHKFSQIAAWDESTVAAMDEKLNARGRIAREGWVAQAKDLTKT